MAVYGVLEHDYEKLAYAISRRQDCDVNFLRKVNTTAACENDQRKNVTTNMYVSVLEKQCLNSSHNIINLLEFHTELKLSSIIVFIYCTI